jgi:hypothetical protein
MDGRRKTEYATARDEQQREWAVRAGVRGSDFVSQRAVRTALQPSLVNVLTLNFQALTCEATTIDTCKPNALAATFLISHSKTSNSPVRPACITFSGVESRSD